MVAGAFGRCSSIGAQAQERLKPWALYVGSCSRGVTESMAWDILTTWRRQAGAALRITRNATETWEDFLRRRAEHLQHKADTWKIQSGTESALLQSARYAGHVARGHHSDHSAMYDTTACHLRGRLGLCQLAVMQAETTLVAFVAECATDQGLRICVWLPIGSFGHE